MSNDESFRIKNRSEAIRKSSILSIVKEKEFEIKAEIVKTRQKAEEILKSAKLEADKLLEEAKERAILDAQKKKEAEIEHATKKAKHILKGAHASAKELEKNFQAIVKKASEKVVSLLYGETKID